MEVVDVDIPGLVVDFFLDHVQGGTAPAREETTL
jgi:hypothetical protein